MVLNNPDAGAASRLAAGWLCPRAAAVKWGLRGWREGNADEAPSACAHGANARLSPAAINETLRGSAAAMPARPRRGLKPQRWAGRA